jgi:sucrose-6F-phosphate phosphohydrolase
MLLLATDLDGTFLGGKPECRDQLYKLISRREDIILGFVTGRGIESVVALLKDASIPNPDYIICDVGATILNGVTMQPIQPLQQHIEDKWPGNEVVNDRLLQVKGLRPQQVPQARRCSYFFDESTDMNQLFELVDDLGCDIIVSAGKFADVLPKGVNKGSTLKQLIQLLDFPENSILVAGDTLNDLSLYETGYKAVVVGEAEPALLEATLNKSHVFTAVDPGAGGIIQAIKHFKEFEKYILPEDLDLIGAN